MGFLPNAKTITKNIPGLLLSLTVAGVGLFLSNVIRGLETFTLILLLGLIINHVFTIGELFQPGISFSMNSLIKLAIIFLGFRLNLTIIGAIGIKSFVLLLFFVPFILFCALLIGKMLRLNNSTSMLIGVGSAICGVAAIMAVSPLMNAKKNDIAVSISVITFLGALGVVIFSFAGSLGFFPLEPISFGVWSGISLHGVPHAVAAAFSMGEIAGESGTIIKLSRVLMIIPLSFTLSYYFRKKNEKEFSEDPQLKSAGAIFPYYIIIFLIVILLNTFISIQPFLVNFFSELSGILFMMVMAAMGLSISFKQVIGPAVKGLQAGALLFLLSSVTGLLIIMVLY